MKSNKKYKGIESLKATYGRRFILIWQIGIVLFIIVPIIQSIGYSFSKISMVDTGLSSVFVGLSNYIYAIR
jgi:ABC-type sugar transport system permease subunit